MIKLLHSAVVENGNATLDGGNIFQSRKVSFDLFSRELYQHLQLIYPKFYKMDGLCKLAFLGAEILLKNADLNPSKTAIFLGTNSGSLQSDKAHQASINHRESYFPSPAVFVYTLPNIMLGEICIRHGITGENSCFLMPDFDRGFFEKPLNVLLNKKIYDKVIFGWAEFTPKNYKCELFLAMLE